MIDNTPVPARALFEGIAPKAMAAAFVFALAPASMQAQTLTEPATEATTSAATSSGEAAVNPASGGEAAAGADLSGDMQPDATASIALSDGTEAGVASLMETASGAVLFRAELKGLPPGGAHAIHLHETGTCDGPDFKSAGGHFAAGKEHGILNPAGPHPGDMPNFTVDDDGTARVEVFMSGFKTADLLDDDGSAVVIHAGTDDYESQPAGDAGDRIACGVIEAR